MAGVVVGNCKTRLYQSDPTSKNKDLIILEHLLTESSRIITYACRAAAMLAFPLSLPIQSGRTEDVDALIRLFYCLS